MKNSLTELRFRELFSLLPNGCDTYYLSRKIDNQFSLSYHLFFPQKGIKLNFWFDKISYLNSNETVTVSLCNRNEKFAKDRLKNILKTNSLDELEAKINEVFNLYK